MNVLFVCGKNRLRSPTAEQVFASHPGVEVASAGVDADADERASDELVGWADVVLVMEETHARKLRSRLRRALGDARVASLDIPDRFAFMDTELVELLRARVTPYLSRRTTWSRRG